MFMKSSRELSCSIFTSYTSWLISNTDKVGIALHLGMFHILSLWLYFEKNYSQWTVTSGAEEIK